MNMQLAENPLVLVPSDLADSSIVRRYLESLPGDLNLTRQLIAVNHDQLPGSSQPDLSGFGEIICLLPPLYALAKTIAGDDSDFCANILIRAAMIGKPVRILINADFCSISGPQKRGRFFDNIRSLLDDITAIGFTVGYLGDRTEVPQSSDLNDLLVTEKLVVDQYRAGCRQIRINSQSIITPLARDKAAELKMTIEKVQA